MMGEDKPPVERYAVFAIDNTSKTLDTALGIAHGYGVLNGGRYGVIDLKTGEIFWGSDEE